MSSVAQAVEEVLKRLSSPLAVQSILTTHREQMSVEVGQMDVVAVESALAVIEAGLKVFTRQPDRRHVAELRRRMTGGALPPPRSSSLHVSVEDDVVVAQVLCQELVRYVFQPIDRVRLITVVSELARNIYMYARSGEIHLVVAAEPRSVRFEVVATDQGPGIADLELVLSGKYGSKTGLGRGLVGAKALLDEMEIQTRPGRGTTIRGMKRGRAGWA